MMHQVDIDIECLIKKTEKNTTSKEEEQKIIHKIETEYINGNKPKTIKTLIILLKFTITKKLIILESIFSDYKPEQVEVLCFQYLEHLTNCNYDYDDINEEYLDMIFEKAKCYSTKNNKNHTLKEYVEFACSKIVMLNNPNVRILNNKIVILNNQNIITNDKIVMTKHFTKLEIVKKYLIFDKSSLCMPFIQACGLPNIDAVKFLNNDEHNPDTLGNALWFACSRGHDHIVTYLISLGADVNYNKGYPLVCAIYRDQLLTVKTLFDNGVKILDDKPLKLAKFYGNVSMIEYLNEQVMTSWLNDFQFVYD